MDDKNKFDNEQKEKAAELKILLFINLSLCYHKDTQFRKSLEYASKALELDKDNIKALYRRGLALVEIKEWTEARRDYDRCLELDPGNKQVARAKATLLKLSSKQDEKDKKKYKNLLPQLFESEPNDDDNKGS